MKKLNLFTVINLDNKKFEKNLIYGAIVFILLLIFIQALMVNPTARNFITQEEQVEGVFLDDTKSLNDKGFIVIELENAEKMDGLWIMINGKRIARFSGKRISLPVSDGELIEIDGTGVSKTARVRIVSKSDNTNLSMNMPVTEVNSNIATLARIKLKTAGSY